MARQPLRFLLSNDDGIDATGLKLLERIARGFSDTFAGIYPGHIAGFIAAQIAAVFVGHAVLRWIFTED